MMNKMKEQIRKQPYIILLRNKLYLFNKYSDENHPETSLTGRYHYFIKQSYIYEEKRSN